jgi:hypothetical protein
MIKFTYKYLKPVALFLAVAVLFQCCKAYDLQTRPIEQAVGPQIRYVKIITNDNREYLFDSLYYKNDVLYGHLQKSTKKNPLDIELKEDKIKEIYIHVLNPKKSKWRTAALIVVPCSIILALFGLAFFGHGHDD